jgi:hypothetical protein
LLPGKLAQVKIVSQFAILAQQADIPEKVILKDSDKFA